MARTARRVRSLLTMLWIILFIVGLAGVGTYVHSGRAAAAEVQNRSVTLSKGEAGVDNVEYLWRFTANSPDPIGSIRFQLCANTPLYLDPCDPPPGFDASTTFIASQTGMTGFLVSSDSTANEIVLTRPPASGGPVTAQYNLVNIHNPDNGGPLYARVQTFSSSDASGPFVDYGGMAIEILPGLSVSAEVPPYLTFCLGESITAFDCNSATEPFSELGNLTPNITSAAQSQIVVATNGDTGYTMRAAGGTMTSGSNVIPAMSGGTSAKGTAQFGMNLVANSVPPVGQNAQGPGTATVDPAYAVPDHFRFASGDIVAAGFEPSDFRKYTVSYIVNIPKGQPGGVYSTTITYVCLANF